MVLYGSLTLTLLFGLRSAANVKATSAEVTGTPSCHRALCARWYVIDRPSAAMSPLASVGTFGKIGHLIAVLVVPREAIEEKLRNIRFDRQRADDRIQRARLLGQRNAEFRGRLRRNLPERCRENRDRERARQRETNQAHRVMFLCSVKEARRRPAANACDDMTNSTSRIQDIAPEQLSPEQKAVLEAVQAGRGFLPAPYRVWLHNAPVAERMERLGTHLNKRGLLSEREFEIAIVLVGQQLNSPYVVDAHLKALVRTGHPPEAVDAMRARRRPTFATERESVIYDIAMNTYDPQPASDELFDRATRVLGRDGLAELIVLIGYYTSVALAMKMHRVPVPEK